ncbi:ATP-binding protein [Bacillus pseudomycoides]
MYNNRHDCWEAFWQERVMVNGELDIEQIKQELFAYKNLIDRLSPDPIHFKVPNKPYQEVKCIVSKTVQKHKEKTSEQSFIA